LAVLIFPLQGFVTGVREYLPVPAPAGVSPLFAQCFVIIAPVYFGMVEEVAFRGVLQRPVIGSFGFAGGVLLIAALFIVWHLPLAQFEYQYVGYTVMALSLGFLAATSGSLKLCVMSHGFTNLLLNALIVAIGWPALMKFYAERLIPLCLASSVLLGIAIFSGRGLWVSWRR
jgi:membrane protease YdiL (CAAX protease family)